MGRGIIFLIQVQNACKEIGRRPLTGNKQGSVHWWNICKIPIIQCWECEHIYRCQCKLFLRDWYVIKTRVHCSNSSEKEIFSTVPMTSRRERFSASPMPWSITSLPTEWNCGTYLHTYSESLISSTNKIIANCSCHTHIYSSHNSKAHWLGLKTHFNYSTSLW